MSELTMLRGDTKTLPFTATRNSAVLDLDDAKVWFTVKRSVADEDEDAFLQKTEAEGIEILDEDEGTLVVTIDAEDTDGLEIRGAGKTLYWDLQVKMGTGEVDTIDSGTLVITPDVTRATS